MAHTAPLVALCYIILVSLGDAKKNVLFLVSDDMRPQINAWEGPNFPDATHPKMHTPNLDALAGRRWVNMVRSEQNFRHYKRHF